MGLLRGALAGAGAYATLRHALTAGVPARGIGAMNEAGRRPGENRACSLDGSRDQVTEAGGLRRTEQPRGTGHHSIY